MQQALDQVLSAAVASGGAPGCTAIVVDKSGTVYEGAAGERAIGSGIAMTTDTVGAIFSMTKAVTGAAVMQLVEQGRIDLDGPASAVCPDMGDAVVLDGVDADGAPVTRPAASQPTLRQLLTHTSGYVYDIWSEEMAHWHAATETPTVLSLEKQGLRIPLLFDPGTRWHYGIGIDWAGLMVEAISGMTLGEYFADQLTGPLGMSDTAFTHTNSMLDRASAFHARMPDSSFATMDLPPPENPEFEMGGGGLHSTMGDYGRFMRMILNDGELDGTRVLAAETVHQMVSNQMGDLRVSELKTMAPPFSNDAEMFPDVPKSWGLTFQIHEADGATGCPAGTLSWAGLSNCYFWIDRTNGIAGAWMSQILPFADEGAINVFYDMQRAVYANR